MYKIVFLGSGGGGNLKFIHQYFNNEYIEISGVITDRDCGALNYGLKNNIPSIKMNFDRNDFIEEKKIISKLKECGPDLIITNIHKILGERIVKEFTGKLINLHYSYLPAFKGKIGMAPVNEALKLNNQFIATTCHFVSNEVDSGKTISQGIFNKNLVENVYQATFETGALTLLSGINKLLTNKFSKETTFGNYYVSPGIVDIDIKKCLQIFNNLK